MAKPVVKVVPQNKRPLVADTVDGYIAAWPLDVQYALKTIQKAIKAAIPDSTELISYQIPMFKYKGRFLVGYAAYQQHLGLYAIGQDVRAAFAAELKPYGTRGTKATIRFPLDKPVPAALITKLVKAQMAANEKAATAVKK